MCEKIFNFQPTTVNFSFKKGWMLTTLVLKEKICYFVCEKNDRTMSLVKLRKSIKRDHSDTQKHQQSFEGFLFIFAL